MKFKDILELMIKKNVSDAFVRINSPLKGRVDTKIETLGDKNLEDKDVETILNEIVPEKEKVSLLEKKSCEFALWYRDQWRFRVSAFYQRNTPALVIRKIDLLVPSFKELNLPEDVLVKFSKEQRGLILLTGVTGSGKSTTIASLIEYINTNSARHILTVEEPIEFTFMDKKSIINQREIGHDVANYEDALKQFALHSPDVIYIGNIRDQRTCSAALMAAATGVLVVATLHTVNAASTVERIIDFFPPYQHHLILNELSFLLKGTISLRLIPREKEKGLIPAYEVMTLSPSVSRLLRENKLWELPKYIESGNIYGMISFRQCLLDLVQRGKISPEIALDYADKRQEFEMELNNLGLLKNT